MLSTHTNLHFIYHTYSFRALKRAHTNAHYIYIYLFILFFWVKSCMHCNNSFPSWSRGISLHLQNRSWFSCLTSSSTTLGQTGFDQVPFRVDLIESGWIRIKFLNYSMIIILNLFPSHRFASKSENAIAAFSNLGCGYMWHLLPTETIDICIYNYTHIFLLNLRFIKISCSSQLHLKDHVKRAW